MNRKASKLERRRLIVETAAECFIERGFHQTSIRDIANKAGISLGNLYNHFEGKAELIAEIAEIEAEEIRQILKGFDGNENSEFNLPEFVSAYFDHLAVPENAVLSAEITAEAIRNPAVAIRFEKNRANLISHLAKNYSEFGSDNMNKVPLILDLIETAAFRAAFENPKPKANIKRTLLAVISQSCN